MYLILDTSGVYGHNGHAMFFRKRRVYLDYASATPVLPEAARAAARAAETFGNPGAIHAEGVEAAASLQRSREKVALELACKAREIVFVSGGTEANNLAILGFARKFETTCPRFDLGHRGRTSDSFGYRGPTSDSLYGTHWVTSVIEHPSVLECFSDIERRGGVVTHVDPNAKGIVQVESVARALRPETVFVSVQWANHEIGTIQPLHGIRAAIDAHEAKHASTVIFHSDMGQAPLYLSPQVHGLGVDIATLDSGKLYGPRGVGCVYINNRVELVSIIVGGGQERGLRAGTENVALAAGFAEAFAIIARERHAEAARVRNMQGDLAREIGAGVPAAVINGDLKHSLPHIFNISIPHISSEYVTLQLDRAGVAISTKSACREGEESRSHVVEALGDVRSAASFVALAKEERAQNTLRFSLGRDTTGRDLRSSVKALHEALKSIRYQVSNK